MQHTLSVLVENSPGVLARVAGLFSRRGFNIESLAVGPTEQEDRSRITLRVDASQHSIDQVIKQLYKLIEVLKVVDLSTEPAVERELALIKVNATAQTRAEIMQLVAIYEARIVDVTRNTMIIEIARSVDKVEALISLLRPFGIKEVARTGRVAMSRGAGEVIVVRDEASA
jgi:acetolactate synthase I/III small subunit